MSVDMLNHTMRTFSGMKLEYPHAKNSTENTFIVTLLTSCQWYLKVEGGYS